MNQEFLVTMQSALNETFANLFGQLGIFLPKFVAAILVLVLGTAVAKWLKSLTVKIV